MRKVLIANRGEIACRLMIACREFGYAVVAVYADADAEAPHVWLADEAVALPGATPAETYLNAPALIAIALATGADALHPGYGFLSEDADFARACEAAGLLWIGPPADAIARFGHKREAREALAAAGIPVLPGGPIGPGHAPPAAEDFPVMVKAATGGGGLGLRLAATPAEFGPAVADAAARCAAAFSARGATEGTEAPELYWEAYVVGARHLEVQVLADRFGAVGHLGERECSVQRRHQKVVEECPAPALDATARAALAELAVRVAALAHYVNVGTVEFLWTPERGPVFLEVNTRLQVEHAVTECVWGVDLAQAQLRLAAGEPLASVLGPAPQPRGHSIEARLYAEDPDSGLPAPGRIDHLAWPLGPWLRVDAGVKAGDVVGPYFDSLLAKIVAWGPDRASAQRRLAGALARTEIAGTLVTNLARLRAVLASPEFTSAAVDTQWLEREPALEPLAAGLQAQMAVAAHVAISLPAEGQAAAAPALRANWASRRWREGAR